MWRAILRKVCTLTFGIEKSSHTIFPVHDVEGEVYPLPHISPLHLAPVQQIGSEMKFNDFRQKEFVQKGSIRWWHLNSLEQSMRGFENLGTLKCKITEPLFITLVENIVFWLTCFCEWWHWKPVHLSMTAWSPGPGPRGTCGSSSGPTSAGPPWLTGPPGQQQCQRSEIKKNNQ